MSEPRHWYHAPGAVSRNRRGATQTLVYRNVDGEKPLHIYASLEDGIVCIDQGGDRIALPHEDIGQLLETLEAMFVSEPPAPVSIGEDAR